MIRSNPSILIGTDFRQNSKDALRVGLAWAQKMSMESIVAHIHHSSLSRETLRNTHLVDSSSEKYTEASFLQQIADEVEDLKGKNSSAQNISYKVFYGNPSQELVKQALVLKPELLVLGTKEHTGLNQFFLGSVTEKVIQTCTFPVLAVRDLFAQAPQRITFLCDFSSISARAWNWAQRLSQLFHAKLEIVHALMPAADFLATEQEANKELALMTGGKSDSNISSLLLHGKDPKEEILQHLNRNRPHLLVMGSHGRSALKKLSLGSNATYLLGKSDCNILIVRPE